MKGFFMAKKKKFSYKDLKVNEEELSITKIGEMPNENKSPAFLFLIFGILIVFVFFLPEVVKYFEKDSTIITESPSTSEENKEEELPLNELVYYDLNSSLKVNLEDGIKISNFVVNDNSLSFTITNNKMGKFYFSKRNYFIELYT